MVGLLTDHASREDAGSERDEVFGLGKLQPPEDRADGDEQDGDRDVAGLALYEYGRPKTSSRARAADRLITTLASATDSIRCRDITSPPAP